MRSWNIQHRRCRIQGPKTEIEDFAKILSEANIFSLQETKGEIVFQNYKCFNKLRKPATSGGLCIGVHRSLAPGCSAFPIPESQDIQGIKLDKRFFGLRKNLIILNIYNSPENSSYKLKAKKKNQELEPTLETLANVINKIPQNMDLLITGDFNSRIGVLPDGMPNDKYNHPNPNGGQSLPARSSKDKTHNSNSKAFLDLVIAEDLRILNGRTLGDLKGEFTCLKYNGNSVVDYMAVSCDITNTVSYFKVLPITPYSDHRPIEVGLETNTKQWQSTDLDNKIKALEDQSPGYKWDNSSSSSNSNRLYRDQQLSEESMGAIKVLMDRPIESKDDVSHLNRDITAIYISAADNSLKRKKTTARSNNHKWFDWECRESKRERNTATRDYNNDPEDTTTREAYYTAQRTHKKLINTKKNTFMRGLNEEIEDGQIINWAAFKRLKTTTATAENTFDGYDMLNFYSFFKNLYAKNAILTEAKINTFKSKIDELQQLPADDTDESFALLNADIDTEELNTALKKLKPGKSASYDLLLNEMLRCSSNSMKDLLLKLFNNCLKQGIYPWNMSLMTILHKKGDRQDPNNYRSICVGSAIGKLFSDIFLQRLIQFRKSNCPDPPNQLGFCQGAQTSDHILTLNTLIDKYSRKQKKNLFTCFVDYRKAFDTVCREALLYKIINLGIRGNFFNCLQHMYQNSSTKIKLIKKLSEKIDILVGTEQGHVMSPELFKLYINGLTELLNNSNLNTPELNSVTISHLLWADDLVLIALDPGSLQTQINILQKFCEEWGLEVNFDKTQILIFNKSGRRQDKKFHFTFGDATLEHTSSYSYLGMTFTISGSFKLAKEELRKKTLRAYFSLKKSIDTRHMSYSAINILYDTLVKPVQSYGCQVWYPTTNIAKHLRTQSSLNPTETLKKIAADEAEREHLRFIKWSLGVHRKSSNIEAWGDSGRAPLLLTITKQVLDYFQRVKDAPDDSLVYHAFQEQKNLRLDWYTGITELCRNFSPPTSNADETSFRILETTSAMNSTFRQIWSASLRTSAKLKFYTNCKEEFGREPYLQLKDQKLRQSLSRTRLSAHFLGIETGRYNKAEGLFARKCDLCSPDVDDLRHLPFFDPVIEDEWHFLVSCPANHDLRSRLPEETLSRLLQGAAGCDIKELFKTAKDSRPLAIYLANAFKRRKLAKEEPPSPT